MRAARRACAPARAGARRAGVRAAADAAQRDAQPGPGQRGQPGARRLRDQHRHLPGPDQEPGAEAAALQPGCARRRRRRCCACRPPPRMAALSRAGCESALLRAGLPTLTSAPAGGAQEGPAAAAPKGLAPASPCRPTPMPGHILRMRWLCGQPRSCPREKAFLANAGEAGLDEEDGVGQWERAWAALMWTFGGGCAFSLVAAQVRGHPALGLKRCAEFFFGSNML